MGHIPYESCGPSSTGIVSAKEWNQMVETMKLSFRWNYCANCGQKVHDTQWVHCPQCGVRIDRPEPVSDAANVAYWRARYVAKTTWFERWMLGW